MVLQNKKLIYSTSVQNLKTFIEQQWSSHIKYKNIKIKKIRDS